MSLLLSFRFAPRDRIAHSLVLSLGLLILAGTQVSANSAPEPITVPRFTHPGAGQIFYFVLTDRFANGTTANDTGGIAGGSERNGFDPARISHFHGGDFVGMTSRLDYLKRLGVSTIWVTPPLKNKAMQSGTAGYHGYWITDFLQIDPHLGTNEEYREFIRQAHAHGLRVFMDIVVNHTADVIYFADGDFTYRGKSAASLRDASGKAIDEHAIAYNGLNDPSSFPALSAKSSFPRTPVVHDDELTVKNPAWLNDVTLYHNRGNSLFQGENSIYGDFGGLDDTFTEHPRVVKGFIDIFSQWLDYGVDGYRIDTVRHVNSEFWQAFSPAIRARARTLGRPDFLQFGEVANDAGDMTYLSEFSTGTIPMDTTTDFGFFAAARRFVSQGGTAAALADFIARDDYYTDHDSNVHSTTTFLGNHDAGRFSYFLQQDNPGATPAQLADLVRIGHGLLFLSRGQPVVYYGDEQGMIGRGGGDMQAREDMFPSQSPEFKTAALLGTSHTGADDKFDESHPFYQFFAKLGVLRADHRALRIGAMIPRLTSEPGLFAFSRVERGERIEYLIALNNSRTADLTARVSTSQPAGATLTRIFDSRAPDRPGNESMIVDNAGMVPVSLAPLQFSVWRATSPLAAPPSPLRIALVTPAADAALTFNTREVDGVTFPNRREIRAEVTGGDGVAEVTFAMTRSSRPDQFELLGTDDAAPYRVFWEPPSDLAPGEKLEFIATANDLRSHRAVARVANVTIAPNTIPFGIRDAKTPRITEMPPGSVAGVGGQTLSLTVKAEGTGPLEFQWLHDDDEIAGATASTYAISSAGAQDAGSYRVLVHNLAGTTLSPITNVTIAPRKAE